MLFEVCEQALSQMQLSASAEQVKKVVAYLELLDKWNRVHNLTAIKSAEEMVFRHILDSLSIAPHLQGSRIADVGSGAGLPGIPLAIFFPERQFTLIESATKRVQFLRQVIHQLSLSNVEVIHSRVENVSESLPFDTIVTRAFAKLPKMLQLIQHLCDNQSKILAMKGDAALDEISHLPNWVSMEAVVPLTIPTKDWQHHLLVIRKTTSFKD
jgi:16S rRNA (guanine527-N7)-methyltransferase